MGINIYIIALCMAVYIDFGKHKSFFEFFPQLLGYFAKLIVWAGFGLVLLKLFQVWVVILVPILLFCYIIIIKTRGHK